MVEESLRQNHCPTAAESVHQLRHRRARPQAVPRLLNATVKPILKVVGFPITVLTLGVFLLVINVIIVKLADYLIGGFSVDGFLSTLIFSIALSLVTSVVDMIVD
ncbi:MAG: phage holin family protein [Hymenobacter sp.]|nr:MAG: phage holin family protein [Hymenobacter sp.]